MSMLNILNKIKIINYNNVLLVEYISFLIY